MNAPLGIIGAGAIGGTLARLAVAAGLDVVLSNSRGPQTLINLVQELGPHARAATVRDVAREADVVIAAIPFIAYTDLPARELAGKLVIDTTNYYDALDIGGLAGSWRSEPGTPVYCEPYMPAWPTQPLSADQLLEWLLAAPVTPLSTQRVDELVATAVRGPAGGFFPEVQ